MAELIGLFIFCLVSDMNNQEAQGYIDNCLEEFERIYHLVKGHGGTSPIVPFLINYSVVKACGTIEVCFKTIIADAVTGTSQQIINYIDHTVRNTSKNPSRDNIHRTLKMFDHDWMRSSRRY